MWPIRFVLIWHLKILISIPKPTTPIDALTWLHTIAILRFTHEKIVPKIDQHTAWMQPIISVSICPYAIYVRKVFKKYCPNAIAQNGFTSDHEVNCISTRQPNNRLVTCRSAPTLRTYFTYGDQTRLIQSMIPFMKNKHKSSDAKHSSSSSR